MYTMRKYWDKCVLFFGALFVMIPVSPWNMPFSYRDSGVFLYVGWRILQGDIPYKDVWDHKPPLVFFLDALGLSIFHNRWGVWVIEIIFLLIAVFVSFYFVKTIFGRIPAILAVMLWLFTLVFVLEGGNLTEEYALPFQFTALWLLKDIDKRRFWKQRFFVLGLLGMFSFMLKQPTIGIWVSFLLYVIVRDVKEMRVADLLKRLTFMLSGGIVAIIPLLLFFYKHSALIHLWEASFLYNFAYSDPVIGIARWYRPLIKGISPLKITGLFQIAMVGYVLIFIFVIFSNYFVQWRHLLIIALIDLPLEFLLVSTSGRNYPHYYITVLPILSLFAGGVFYILFSAVQILPLKKGVRNVAYFLFVVGVIGSVGISSLDGYINEFNGYSNTRNRAGIINFVEKYTSIDDYVLMWGAETSVNYFARRASPSRFVYQFPLYEQEYTNEALILEFLEDLLTHEPKLIIDTKNRKTPMYGFPLHTEAIDEKILLLENKYCFFENVNNWDVYMKCDAMP